VLQLDKMTRAWKPAWYSRSPLAVPNFSIKVAVKYIVMHYLLSRGGAEIGATGRYVYPVDYQVLVKR
jgi:hypothetical protein